MRYLIYIKEIIVLLLTILQLASCSMNEKKIGLRDLFDAAVIVGAKDSVCLDSLDLVYAYDVIPIRDKFIFLHGKQNYHITCCDFKNNCIVQNVFSGNGPNEVVSFLPIKSNSPDVFLYADRVRKKVFSIALDSCTAPIKEEFQINDSVNRFFQMVTNNSECYYGTGLFTKGRFCAYNKNTKQATYFGRYPDMSGVTYPSPMHEAALFSSSLICIHPRAQKLCVVYQGFFDIYDNEDVHFPQIIKSLRFEEPKVQINGYDGPAVIYDRENIVGAISVTCNTTGIYVLYSTQTFEEQSKTGKVGNLIILFDWNGDIIKKYKVDHSLSSIVNDDGLIYAINNDGSILYEYNI